MTEAFFMGGLLQNLVLFILLSFKVLFFLRIYPTFGIIVSMFLGMTGRLTPFICFLLFVICIFSVIFTLLGCNFGTSTWVPFMFMQPLQTFNIATGNTPTASYDFWIKYHENHLQSTLPYIMIYVIYIVFTASQVFIFIILTNFFIAMVGQVYDENMNNSQVQEYDHMAEMNKECFMFQEFINREFFGADKKKDCFLL